MSANDKDLKEFVGYIGALIEDFISGKATPLDYRTEAAIHKSVDDNNVIRTQELENVFELTIRWKENNDSEVSA